MVTSRLSSTFERWASRWFVCWASLHYHHIKLFTSSKTCSVQQSQTLFYIQLSSLDRRFSAVLFIDGIGFWQNLCNNVYGKAIYLAQSRVRLVAQFFCRVIASKFDASNLHLAFIEARHKTLLMRISPVSPRTCYMIGKPTEICRNNDFTILAQLHFSFGLIYTLQYVRQHVSWRTTGIFKIRADLL